jgi:hypothetical protein
MTVMGGWGTQLARHTVSSDDDLSNLALHYYGDPRKWRVILEFNGLSANDTISDGAELLIPQPLETPVEIPAKPSGGTFQQFAWIQKEQSKRLSEVKWSS